MIPLKEALINKNTEVNASALADGRNNYDLLRDSSTWQVGDFIYITYNYNACIPVFYKIIRKSGKATFYIQEYEKTLSSGFYNSPAGYEVIPNEKQPRGSETKQVRSRNGVVKIDKHIACKWDGKPVHEYSD